MPDTNLEYDYRILEKLEHQPDISQRELAEHLGVSVGKANFVLSALIERGLVKAQNFKSLATRPDTFICCICTLNLDT